MSDLTQNIDKLHTTPMGAERIRRSLNLQVDDPVIWCKDVVENADTIIGQGKNWYVYKDGVGTKLMKKQILSSPYFEENPFRLILKDSIQPTQYYPAGII